MHILLQYDPSFATAEPGEKAAIEQAAAILDALITDPITVTIHVGLDEADGVKFPLGAIGLDIPTGEQYFSYSQVLSALQAHADTPLAQQILAAFPSQAQAGQTIGLLPAQAYALGLATPAAGAVDGYIGFRSDIPVDGQLVLYLHEMTHALGRVRDDSLQSLYSYSAPGVLAGDQNTAAYFSIDGGKTNLATFDPYDPSDWTNLFNPSYTSGATALDQLTALGFHINPAPVVTAQIPFQDWRSGGSFNDTISADFFHSAQPLTYSATMADGSALPSWLSFNATTLTFSGTLPTSLSTASIKLTASNSLGSASEIFDVETPIAASTKAIIDEHLTAGQSFSLNLDKFFTGPVTSQTQFTVMLAQSVGQAYNIWNQTNLPSWLHLDATTHTLSGTMPAQGGLYDLEIGAWNADGNASIGGNTTLLGYTTVSFNLSTISLPIAVKPMVSQVVAAGQSFTIHLPNPVFTDSSAPVTSITLGGQDFYASTQYSSPPQLPWTSFNPVTGTISGTAPSSGSDLYHLQLTATDSNQSVGGADVFVFVGGSITVNELRLVEGIGIPLPALTLTDTVQNVFANSYLITQNAGSAGIQSIKFTDAGPVTLSLNVSGFDSDEAVLKLVSSPFKVAMADYGYEISNALDQLESLAASGELSSISLTDGGSLSLTPAQLAHDADALKLVITPYKLAVSSGVLSAGTAASFGSHLLGAVTVSDTAANVSANFDALQSLAAAGNVSSITLTDGGIPTLSLTTAQAAGDASVLKDIAGNFSVVLTAPTTSATIAGLSTGLGNTVKFSGPASSYSVTPAGDGVNFNVVSSSAFDRLHNVQAVQFSDTTLIVAQAPGTGGTVTTGNVTELYAAVLGREPDVAGLAYYQSELAANSSIPLTTFAQWFLASPEYADNPAHAYAQTTAGDAQFITDSYQNLLHRTPSAVEIAYYQNVIAPFAQNLTPGTPGYAGAAAQAHALVLTYFSQSPEYLSDVQVTALSPPSAQHFLLLI